MRAVQADQAGSLADSFYVQLTGSKGVTERRSSHAVAGDDASHVYGVAELETVGFYQLGINELPRTAGTTQ